MWMDDNFFQVKIVILILFEACYMYNYMRILRLQIGCEILMKKYLLNRIWTDIKLPKSIFSLTRWYYDLYCWEIYIRNVPWENITHNWKKNIDHKEIQLIEELNFSFVNPSKIKIEIEHFRIIPMLKIMSNISILIRLLLRDLTDSWNEMHTIDL